jgi:hypothetical protein
VIRLCTPAARRRRCYALLVAGVTLASAVAGCGRGEPRPVRLLDGSLAHSLPRTLGSLGAGAVVSTVRVLPASRLGRHGRACLAAFRDEFAITPATRVVVRVGVVGATLTFKDGTGRVVLGCDRSAARAGKSGSWCAHSVGRLAGGRLDDPRVDILCLDARGDPVGFGWVDPRAPGARWIVVRGGQRSEVEPVVAGFPVRVVTNQVDRLTSSATFAVTEYAANGAELARYRLRAGVAG